MRFRLTLITFLLLAGTGIVFYLSWLPDPALSKYGFLPNWLARWTDAEVNDNLRTAVPLLFLGICIGCWLSITKRGWPWWIMALLGSLSGLGLVAMSSRVMQFVAKQLKGEWQPPAKNTQRNGR